MPKVCDAPAFDAARKAYDEAPIHAVAQKADTSRYNPEHFRFYVSTLQRTHDTCHGLFGDVPTTETPLLTEVPNRSFADTALKLPYPCYQALGRFGWFFNLKRQPEGKKQSTARAEELVSMLEQRNEDCILVSHEFYLYTLLRVLKKHGFRIKRRRHGRIRNLEQILAVNDTASGF